MFHFLKLVAWVLVNPRVPANPRNIDKDSCRAFLLDLVVQLKSLAAKTSTKLDDAFLKQVEFIVSNTALFDYVYRLIADQLQTEEILFEEADDETIVELVGSAASNNTKTPEAVDPVVIVSLISQIISVINAIKAARNR